MLNNVAIVGRVVRDLELKEFEKGCVCNFTLACQRTHKNADGEYEADFIDMSVYNESAKRFVENCVKGDLVAVTGRLKTDSYKNADDKTIYKTIVQVSNISYLTNKKKESETKEA